MRGYEEDARSAEVMGDQADQPSDCGDGGAELYRGQRRGQQGGDSLGFPKRPSVGVRGAPECSWLDSAGLKTELELLREGDFRVLGKEVFVIERRSQ